MNSTVISDQSELKNVAKLLIDSFSTYKIWCFDGDMGVGKTTLIKEICKLLGVSDSMSSPTFSIVNEYRDSNDQPIYHFDFYRIKNEQEALDIGVEEYFYSDDLCLIEWPELIDSLIPEQHLKINIKLVENNQREIAAVPYD